VTWTRGPLGAPAVSTPCECPRGPAAAGR
jgi:hypothetical protein